MTLVRIALTVIAYAVIGGLAGWGLALFGCWAAGVKA